ncbi:Hypothetical predicted protein [Octopus vulgaris]|uniref:Uncharacterized protein n=1 Tax=Octopus vulgaris TaxID=6645 RepID=A0AA36BCP8_OCTVU|nr:Hypothetical predicted protein [Octopus vulgaris]
MNGVLPRYIFVVTIFLWITLSNGCMDTASSEFQSCTAKLSDPVSVEANPNAIRSQMDAMCKMGSEDKKKLDACFEKLTQCNQIKIAADRMGINIMKTMEATREMCEHEETILGGIPCLTEKIMNLLQNTSTDGLEGFQQLYSKGIALFMNFSITREKYDTEYCPLLKEGIEKLADFKCSKEFTKVLQEYGYDMMSDTCRSINKIDSSGIKPLPNISFLSLVFLILLLIVS